MESATMEGGESEPEGWFIPMKESLLLNGLKGSMEKVLVGKLLEVPSRRVTVAATSLSRTSTEPTRGTGLVRGISGIQVVRAAAV